MHTTTTTCQFPSHDHAASLPTSFPPETIASIFILSVFLRELSSDAPPPPYFLVRRKRKQNFVQKTGAFQPMERATLSYSRPTTFCVSFPTPDHSLTLNMWILRSSSIANKGKAQHITTVMDAGLWGGLLFVLLCFFIWSCAQRFLS